MRTLVILACSVALVSNLHAQQENKSRQKKQTQSAQHAAGATSHPAAGGAVNKRMPTTASGGQKPRPSQTSAYQPQKVNQKAKSQGSAAAYQGSKGKRPETSNAAYQVQKGKKNQTQVERQTDNAANKRQAAKAANAGQVKATGKPNQAKIAAGQNAAKPKLTQSKPVKAQHYSVPKQPNTAKAPAMKFQQGKHIQGSQSWQGARYTVFRNYTPQWHNQGWWHNHYKRIVFVFGAPYYWNAGYWFPAWGYYPNAYYAWDGPIYAYNNLPPDQVIANVQATLQQQGYYHGDVDGLVGPLTRGAIADYQRANGLYVTSAIDQPTLQSLGMA
jgi:putative peptidoglycan binding protein